MLQALSLDSDRPVILPRNVWPRRVLKALVYGALIVPAAALLSVPLSWRVCALLAVSGLIYSALDDLAPTMPRRAAQHRPRA